MDEHFLFLFFFPFLDSFHYNFKCEDTNFIYFQISKCSEKNAHYLVVKFSQVLRSNKKL